jgi:hypothetical protein
MNKGVEAFRAQLQKELGLSMQHQLHNAIYRPTLSVLSLARAADVRAASGTALCVHYGMAGLRTLPRRHAPFAPHASSQPEDLS